MKTQDDGLFMKRWLCCPFTSGTRENVTKKWPQWMATCLLRLQWAGWVSAFYRHSIADFFGSHFKEKSNHKILPERTAVISHPLSIALPDLHQLDIFSGKIESHHKVSNFPTHSPCNYSFILKVGFASQVSYLDFLYTYILKPSG